jgi:hypothetical protein
MPADAGKFPDPASSVRTPPGWEQSVLGACRAQAERWLESLLRNDVTRVD